MHRSNLRTLPSFPHGKVHQIFSFKNLLSGLTLIPYDKKFEFQHVFWASCSSFFTYLGHWDGLNDYFKNSLHIEWRYVTTYYVNFCAFFFVRSYFSFFFKGGTASGFYTVEDPVSTAIVFKLNSEISYWYIKSFQLMNSCFHQVYPTRLFRILKTSKLQLEPVSCGLSVIEKSP